MATNKKLKNLCPDELYAEVVQLLNQHFWEQDALTIKQPAFPLMTQADANRAIVELLGALGDRYTVYHEPASAEAVERTRNSVLEGIGVLLAARLEGGQPVYTKSGKARPDKSSAGYPLIMKVFEGTPAEKAGLRIGDEVLSTNGKSTKRIQTLLTFVNRVRGPKGSELNLCIRRQGISQNVRIIRDKYWIPSVEAGTTIKADSKSADGDISSCQARATESGVGYLKILNFLDPRVPRLVQASLQQFNHCHSLVLDLRGNGGGSVPDAIEVAACFIEQGTVLTQEIRGADGITVTKVDLSQSTLCVATNGQPGKPVSREVLRIWDKPFVILVDGKTASAAELLAGTLQELAGAYVIGEQTFGKGIIQSRIDLANGGTVEITSGVYRLPSGYWIGDAAKNRFGVKLDQVVVNQEGEDNQFSAALARLVA
jgi:carboxyl-terminal processing protease